MSTNTLLSLSFDIGYASIGWCVLESTNPAPAEPKVLGTGVVTFPTDDCLASKRRELRRTRRHIRSTRQRIERMKFWFEHRGILSREELDRVPGRKNAPPFLLAAAALGKHKMLSAFELWTVLRWYAHNRGYDGNSLWSRDEADDEDTEKETNAKSLMEKHGTHTMADTVCACLGLDPSAHSKRISSSLPYKTLNAAYPREIVFNEVKELLNQHIGKIPGLDGEAVRYLIKPAGVDVLTSDEKSKLATAGIKLPRRYHGGLLFGQLIPRFDNRIISRCPITWAKIYDEAIAEGKAEGEARKAAEKLAKVPAAKCVEFLEYRFARILANLRADGQPIDRDLRKNLLELARRNGRLTTKDLNREIKAHYGSVKTNIADYFTIHPSSGEALVLDPVADEVRKASESRAKLSPIWKLLSEETKEHIKSVWVKGLSISFAEIFHRNGNRAALEDAIKPTFLKANKPKQEKSKYSDLDHYLRKTSVAPDFPSGRAPYARPVLRQVLDEVLAGHDPTRPARKTSLSDGENKDNDGVLYSLLDPRSRVRVLQSERPLDQLTNNHLVRHRMLILDRLTADITKEFVAPGCVVSQVVVEVARELKEFSGKTAKKITTELNSRLKDFKSVTTYLEKFAPNLQVKGSLIRKARIAMDMGLRCPFTGETYDIQDLTTLEREHIIPYASRNSNALHSLVLTWPKVNKWKGKRTALQFVMDEGGKNVPGKENLTIMTLKGYEDFVGKLDTKGHPDDIRRKKARKALLLTKDMDDKNLGFTDGQLTQTSHLMKLAMRGLMKRFPTAAIDPIPGIVTAELRKAWDLNGTLGLVCPEILDEVGKARPKGEIRGLTHMHHALDAATIAIAAHYFPLRKHGADQKGTLWRALLKRNRSEQEQRILHETGLFQSHKRTRHDHEGTPTGTATELRLTGLSKTLKNALRLSFAEARVMQHVPADQSGLPADRYQWGFRGWDSAGKAILNKHSIVGFDDLGRRIRKADKPKSGANSKERVFGTTPTNGEGKLLANKAVILLNQNYGIALDPKPAILPFHEVNEKLRVLKELNGGKPVRVIRSGCLIQVKKGPNAGNWIVTSAMASMLLKLKAPHYPGFDDNRPLSRKISLSSLIRDGLTLLPPNYTGSPVRLD